MFSSEEVEQDTKGIIWCAQLHQPQLWLKKGKLPIVGLDVPVDEAHLAHAVNSTNQLLDVEPGGWGFIFRASSGVSNIIDSDFI